MTHPLTTTLNRIWAQNLCDEGKSRALTAAGKTAPDDEPITFAAIANAVGLADALWCCRAEPQYSREWRLYAVWCCEQAQHLLTNPYSLAELNAAAARPAAWGAALEAAGFAAQAVAADAAWDAAGKPSQDAPDVATGGAAWAASWSAAWGAALGTTRDAQLAAFLQLVTTGTLPAVQSQEVAA